MAPDSFAISALARAVGPRAIAALGAFTGRAARVHQEPHPRGEEAQATEAETANELTDSHP